MEALPQQIKDVLQKLHDGGFPSAIVAGGAIRDHIFRKPIKDIDVFVSYEDVNKVANPWADFSVTLGGLVSPENWSSYMDIPDVDSVYSGHTLTNELPVQIIVMKPGLSPYSRVAKLDWGFCQACTPDGDFIFLTPGFRRDRNDKTITLVHCENQHEFDRSMIRYERLKQKYPEFTLVIPEEFQKFYFPYQFMKMEAQRLRNLGVL